MNIKYILLARTHTHTPIHRKNEKMRQIFLLPMPISHRDSTLTFFHYFRSVSWNWYSSSGSTNCHNLPSVFRLFLFFIYNWFNTLTTSYILSFWNERIGKHQRQKKRPFELKFILKVSSGIQVLSSWKIQSFRFSKYT